MSNNTVYGAVYSGVPVYEMQCRGVAVMRRRDDSYLNATQILKVAGVDKGRRTKILEREVQVGVHEKVQGGYGKYQGTWIPFERGVTVARQYGVEALLRPILDYVPSADDFDQTPRKKRPSISRASSSSINATTATSNSAANTGSVGIRSARQLAQQQQQQRPQPGNGERYRPMLMSVFLNHEQHRLPDLLTQPQPPVDLDPDLVIDDQGHTSVHWAAALARVNVLQLLVAKLGADVTRVNYNGETALIRAVLVTNNFDRDSFYETLALLEPAIPLKDQKGRTAFHHLSLTAGIKGRVQAARYYFDNLVAYMKRQALDIKAVLNQPDKNQDTALNIAVRVGSYGLIEQMVQAGADPDIPNASGLRPIDFCQEDARLAALFSSTTPATNADGMDASSVPVFNAGLNRADQHAHAVASFESATAAHDEAMSEERASEMATQLHQTTRQLEHTRKMATALGSQVNQLETQNTLMQHHMDQLMASPGHGPASSLLLPAFNMDRIKALVAQALDIPVQAVDPKLAEALLSAVTAELQAGRPVADADLIHYIKSSIFPQQQPPVDACLAASSSASQQ